MNFLGWTQNFSILLVGLQNKYLWRPSRTWEGPMYFEFFPIHLSKVRIHSSYPSRLRSSIHLWLTCSKTFHQIDLSHFCRLVELGSNQSWNEKQIEEHFLARTTSGSVNHQVERSLGSLFFFSKISWAFGFD